MPVKLNVGMLKENVHVGKFDFVEVGVIKVLSETEFVIADRSDSIVLDVTEAPEQGKLLAVGKFVRLIKPEIKDKVLTFQADLKPCPIKAFKIDEISDEEANSLPRRKANLAIKLLKDVCSVSETTTLGTLYLKVVFVSSDKMGRYTHYRLVKVKDQECNKHFVTLYGPIREVPEVGKVYHFTGLKAQPPRLETDQFGLLTSQKCTQILEPPPAVAAKFALVSIGDLELKGVILGHETFNFYECCPNCKKKNHKAGDKCTFCATILKDKRPAFDFNVIFLIADEYKDKVSKVSAFRSHLGFEFNAMNEAEAEKAVEKLHMKPVVIEYDPEETTDTIRVAVFTVKTDSEDIFADSGL